MGENNFKIFLGLELEKNAGPTLNQEITKLTKNGIKLKVELDEKSINQLTSAINGVTQQLQKMSGVSGGFGRTISKGFDEANKGIAPFKENVEKVTEEYRKGVIGAEEYSRRMRKAFMMDSEKGLSDYFKNQLNPGELEEYIKLITNVGKTVTDITPIGEKINTTSFSIIKNDAGELVREVNTYKDSLGRVQTITSIINKQTGELVATQQSLSTNDEKRTKTLESQRVALKKINDTYENIRKFIYDGIANETMDTPASTNLINGYNSAKSIIKEINQLQEQGKMIDTSKINKAKELIKANEELLAKKKQEEQYEKKLEEAIYQRDRLTKQLQSQFDKGNTSYSSGVNEADKQAIQDLINSYAKLDPSQENMKRKTLEIKDALSEYSTKIKDLATEEQKKQVATDKHTTSVEKLKNALKNTNTKYSIGVDDSKANSMEDQIRAFEQLDPLASDYAQQLERIAMRMAQYTTETRDNAKATDTQIVNLAKLKQLQNSLDATTSNTKGFYNEEQANSLNETLEQMRQMIGAGEDVSSMLKLIGVDVAKFGKDSTQAMKESNQALKEEQELYLYKQKTLVNLNTLEQKFSNKGMDTSRIEALRQKVQSLTVDTENLDKELIDVKVTLSQLNGDYQLKKIGTSMKSVLGMATGFYGLYSVFGYLKQAMSSVVTETTKLDDAMLGLHRVTDETTTKYEIFRQSALKSASEIGGSAKEIVDSASEFAKLGYSFEDSTKLAVDATKYATAGEVSLTEATDALSASYTVFGNTFDKVMGTMVDSTSIIDLYNKIGNTMAVTSGDIGIAMKASANSLSVANNSLSESVALIATANKTVQDSSKVGNALRTIAMRVRGVSEDTGEFLPKMRELIQMGTNGKVDIMDGENFKSTYQIMLEIGEVWDELSDKQQAYLAESVAGKNRAEVFTAIMGNAEDLSYAMEMAQDSIGSVDEEMAVVMQTFEMRVKVMQNAWASLANTTLSSGVAKGFVDATTKLIEFADACGGLIPVIAGLVASMVTLKVAEEALTFSSVKAGIKSFIKELITLKTVTDSAGKSMVVLNGLQKASVIGATVAVFMALGFAIHQVATASQRAEERVASLREEVSSLSNGVNSIRSLGEEFEELSKKPNLTAEESQKLYDIQNKIKEMQPEIGGYYDEQGNFIITQVKTAGELVEIQKELVKLKKQELFEESKGLIDKKLEKYEKEKKALQDIAKEQEKAQRIKDGTASAWDKLTYSDDRSKAIMGATTGSFGLTQSIEEKVKEARNNVKEYSQDIHDYLIDAITLDSSWDSLGDASANAIRKGLAEMDGDKLAEFARQISEGELSVRTFVESLKESYPPTEELQNGLTNTSGSASSMEEPLSSLGTVAEQVANDMDILKVSLDELDASNDISEKTMKKLLSKYPELANKIKGVDSAYLALKQKMTEQEFENVGNKIAELTGIMEDLEGGNGLTASSFKKLANTFPELLAYMDDEANLSTQIKSKMEELRQAQYVAYRDMLLNSQEYYKNNVLGNQQMCTSISNGIKDLFTGLASAYEGDLKNWKSLADGKADIEKQLIIALNKAWEDHFGTLMTTFNKMPSTPIATPQFDEKAFEADIKAKNPLMAHDASWVKRQVDFARQQFQNQTSAYQQHQAEMVKRNQQLAQMFDVKFNMPDMNLGGAKFSPSSSSSSSSSNPTTSYVASIYQAIVDEILRGGEEIEKAMDETNTKLDNAILMGDTVLEEQLKAKLANLQVALRDKQASMAKELEAQMAEMRDILSKSGAFKGYDLTKLTEKDMAKVVQNIEHQINSATLAENDEEVKRLNDLKSLINDVGGVYLDTIEKRRDLSNQWWQEENNRMTKFAENLQDQYDKLFKEVDKEDKLLQLRKSMLLEDGGRYDKEQKEADKILDINSQLLKNLLKKRTLCESQIAQLRAKGFKDESKEIQDLQDKWLDYEQARLDMIKEIAEARRQSAIESAQNELDDVSTSKDYIKDLLSLTIDMIKQETEAKKEALKKQVDAKKEALKKEYDAEKKALEDKLSLLQKEANARKDALSEEKADKEYQENVSEKQKEISNIQQKIDALSGDDSITNQKLKKELQAQLDNLIKELEKIQYDRSIELQQQAIDKELEMQEEKIEAELEKLEDQYDEEVEMIEDKYDAQLKEYEDYLKNQQKLKEDASKLIESRDKEFYERLKKYAMEYTDTTQAEFEDCWNKAYEALDKYGDKQLSVIEVIEKMTSRVIALNAELKKLNDSTYKDFLQDDPNTSSDDYEYVGDKNNSSSNKKVDEERDEICRKMNENSQKWFTASDEEKKRLAEENKKLAKEIGAWQANQDGNGYKKGDWLVQISEKIVPVKNAVGVRHTGLETGEVGSPFGKFKLKSNEELNKLEKGEIVLNGSQTRNIMDNVKRLQDGTKGNEVSIVVDMHDFNVSKDTFEEFKKLMKTEVPKIINQRLISKGIK